MRISRAAQPFLSGNSIEDACGSTSGRRIGSGNRRVLDAHEMLSGIGYAGLLRSHWLRRLRRSASAGLDSK